MKKIICFLMIFAMIFGMFSMTSGAYNIGDVINQALATDIVATINGYDIPSFNVDGYTYIVAEDLRYYGFSVNYDNSTRALSVNRDFSQTNVSKSYVKPPVSQDMVGTPIHSILYTDISTYLDGTYTQSYNIDGQTIIRFDSLSAYGSVVYDNNKREISLAVQGINYNPNPVDRRSAALLGLYALPSAPDNFYVYIYEYDGKTISFEVTSILGRNATRITGIQVTEHMSNGKCYFDFEDSFSTVGSGVLTIIDDKTIHLDFTTKVQGMGWSVVEAEGYHTKIAELPEDFTLWTNSLY